MNNLERLVDQLLVEMVKRRLESMSLTIPPKLVKQHFKPNGKLKRKYTKRADFWKKPHPRKKS